MTKKFYAGFACALAELNRMHDEPSMVCDVLRGHGVTLADLAAAGVDDYDLTEIRACLAMGNAEDRRDAANVGKPQRLPDARQLND